MKKRPGAKACMAPVLRCVKACMLVDTHKCMVYINISNLPLPHVQPHPGGAGPLVHRGGRSPSEKSPAGGGGWRDKASRGKYARQLGNHCRTGPIQPWDTVAIQDKSGTPHRHPRNGLQQHLLAGSLGQHKNLWLPVHHWRLRNAGEAVADRYQRAGGGPRIIEPNLSAWRMFDTS